MKTKFLGRAILLFVARSTMWGAAAPIHDAAKEGDVAQVRAILKQTPNQATSPDSKHKNTPLHWACYRGHLDVAKVLLARGADINAQTQEGYTPLRDAAYQGHTKLVKLLLDNEASISTPDKKGATPLHWAAHGGQAAALKLLLADKPNLMGRTKDGKTAFEWAEDANQTSSFNLLWKEACLPFLSEVRNDDFATVKAMLKKHPRFANGSGARTLSVKGAQIPRERPLTAATSVKMVKVLLAAGADPTLPVIPISDGSYVQTCLDAGSREPEILKAMLDSGADPDKAYEFDRTPLLASCWHLDEKAVRLLLKYKANPNARDTEGNTPLLQVADEAGRFLGRRSADPKTQIAIARVLLEHGANPSLKNDIGETALSRAQKFGHKELAEFLAGR